MYIYIYIYVSMYTYDKNIYTYMFMCIYIFLFFYTYLFCSQSRSFRVSCAYPSAYHLPAKLSKTLGPARAQGRAGPERHKWGNIPLCSSNMIILYNETNKTNIIN